MSLNTNWPLHHCIYEIFPFWCEVRSSKKRVSEQRFQKAIIYFVYDSSCSLILCWYTRLACVWASMHLQKRGLISYPCYSRWTWEYSLSKRICRLWWRVKVNSERAKNCQYKDGKQRPLSSITSHTHGEVLLPYIYMCFCSFKTINGPKPLGSFFLKRQTKLRKFCNRIQLYGYCYDNASRAVIQ